MRGASHILSTRSDIPFHLAMDLYEQQIWQEIESNIMKHPQNEDVEHDNAVLTQCAKDMRAARKIALFLYNESQKEVRLTDREKELSAAVCMQGHTRELVNEIGYALESGNWSRIAI